MSYKLDKLKLNPLQALLCGYFRKLRKVPNTERSPGKGLVTNTRGAREKVDVKRTGGAHCRC